MTPDPTVMVVGDLVTDVVAQLAEPLAIGSDAAATVTTSGGGGGGNVAAWLGYAGVGVALAARVGDDDAGRARVAELGALGVDVRAAVDGGLPTGTVVVVVTPDGERTMLPDRGANANLAPADLDHALFAAGRHLHLSGYTLFDPTCRAAGLEALRLARDAGMSISVDPASAAPLRSVGAAAFLEWTAGAEVCLPNQVEAAVLSGSEDPETAARRLARHYRQVVVTMGARGAVWTDGERVLHSAAAPTEALDTTGAGDAFTAGWLAALHGDGDAHAAMRRAHEWAGAAVRIRGARPAAAC